MAEESDLTIQILRQIQDKLVQHDRQFERMQAQIDHRFDLVDRRLSELVDGTVKALGTASIANVRHDSVQNQLAEVELELRDVKSRLRLLEERV